MAPPSPNEPRTELGKNFSKKIEVASLAIRASSVQSSLFPEQPPALPTIQHRPQRRAATDEDSDMRHLLDTTRSALMAVEKKGPASPKKAVTFSNTPVVHSIETFVDEDSEDSEKEEMDTETETETETEEDTDYDDEDEDEDEEENTERHHQSQQQELERHMEYDDEDNLMDVISGIASISSHPPPQQSQPPTSSPIFSAPSFNPQRRSFANLPHRLPRDEVLHELSRQRQYIPSMPSSSRNYSDPFLSRRSSTSMDHHLEPIENQIMQAIMRIKASTSQNQDKAHASVASSPPPSQPTPVHRQSVPGNSTLALLTKYPSLLSPQQRQHHAQHNHHSSNGTRVPMPPGTPPPTPPSQKPTLLPSVSPPPPPSTPPPQFPAPPPIEDEESITESETITQECHTPDDKKEKQNVLPSLPKQQFADFGVSLLGEMNRITSEKNVQQQKLQRDQVKQCTKKDSEKQQGPHVALTYKPASEKEKLMMTQTLEKKEDHDPPAATLVWRTVRADEKSHQRIAT
ncbi:hypothetical protein BCR43DRAFT_332053 [Syncephalastrum racemosum]|uniref:Uncharacterized protein n=1 Tax=Syncephalastrum racemosum TaxID=13706 RepID=A0A1X2H871_SYNRA|nr:hypothetical protein BCR43DRAFT_332053 [Syncephalastrum racemosum]